MAQDGVSARTRPAARVAVVIVTYNSADVLGECLHALADEGTPLAAVVVADNASKDETCEIAGRFADLDVTVVQTGRERGIRRRRERRYPGSGPERRGRHPGAEC